MTTIVHGFDWPDRFVTGTVGQPGARTFYLQARQGPTVISVALEKEQSAALAEKIDDVLNELMAQGDNPFSVPAMAARALIDEDPLDQPVEERFRVGALSLGWEPSTAQLVIEAVPLVEIDPEQMDVADEDPAEALIVRIPVGTARAFARRTRDVVSAGRPVCPLCGGPVDSSDHVCDPPEEF